MIRFDRAELLSFVRAIDRHLPVKVSVVVIGGAAATLGYGSGARTSDIDIFRVLEGSAKTLLKAAAQAREETGLGVAIAGAAVAGLPTRYEERLRPVRGLATRRFHIVIPDKYDLVLSKMVRGYPHDVDAAVRINRQHRLSRRTLVGRFEVELWKQARVGRRKLPLNMAMLVARLYGFKEGCILAEKWGVPVPRRPA